jgi:sec-independent protein translocase protein TatA
MWDAPWHWVVLAIVVIALFGYKKLPDAARSLGRSLRIFRTEIKGMGEDDRARSQQAAPELPAVPAVPATPAAPAGAATVATPAPPVTDAEAPVQTANNESA